MGSMRATLTSEAGAELATVEGSIERPATEGGPTTGQFEVEDNPEIMEGVMGGTSFHLAIEGGESLRIKIASVEPTEKDGVSLASFSGA